MHFISIKYVEILFPQIGNGYFSFIYLFKDMLNLEINIRQHFLLSKTNVHFSVISYHSAPKLIVVAVIVCGATFSRIQSCSIQLSRLGDIYMK